MTKRLAAKHIDEAFAVQTGVLPLLLPGSDRHNGDLLVSAATGSGKTLAYMLPLIDGVANDKGNGGMNKLRAIVVVPTRELVNQAKETAEMCAGGLGLQIGVAMGSKALQTEQAELVKTVWRWDPQEHQRILDRGEKKFNEEGELDPEAEKVATALPGHVPDYESAVDILICTPGRLVEHLRHTRGFHLMDCQWLVIDEADRLLDESFQEWVDAVISALDRKPPTSDLVQQLRDSVWCPPPRKNLRKVILSATMTRDLTKLSSLKLSRPKLVVVQGQAETENGVFENGEQDASTLELPERLMEFAIPVGHGSDKPLYLLGLLQQRILPHINWKPQSSNFKKPASSTDSSSESSSDSDSDSDSDSSSDSSSSGSTSESDSESSDDTSDTDSDSSPSPTSTTLPVRSLAPSTTATTSVVAPSILIFTASTESATRLAYLLSQLSPSLSPYITTVTKTTRDPSTRRLLHRLRVSLTSTSKDKASSKPIILISTDLTSRGLDLPLTHIINYDIPTSLPSYIHRAGRTARAGRQGEAWTLFVNREGRWFWGDVARAASVRRERKVQRVGLRWEDGLDGDTQVQEMREKYENALEAMKKKVVGRS
jgi:ATP-dependent RNA helicase DDX51/DBP6